MHNLFIVRSRAIRRANAEAAIDLRTRRTWYEGAEVTPPTTPPATEPTEAPAPDNVGGDGKITATDGMVSMTQSALDKIMADRAAQAKRSVLKEAGIENPDDLKVIVDAHKQAELKRKEAEEANKSALDKKQEQLTAAMSANTEAQSTIKMLRIENAIMRIAPGMSIPPAHFEALIKLMNVDAITMTANKVEDKDVEAALKITLEANPFLVASSNGKSHGSPIRTVTGVVKPPKPEPPVPERSKFRL